MHAFLSDVNPTKVNLKIKVRVSHLFTVLNYYNHSSTGTIELVLLDEKVIQKLKTFQIFDLIQNDYSHLS